MLNSVIMTGRMVADPELRTTQSDIKVTSFRIAVTRNYKVNDEYPSDFFTVVAWRNTAEFVAKHFKKGDGLTVQGRAEVRKFTDTHRARKPAMVVRLEAEMEVVVLQMALTMASSLEEASSFSSS